VHTDHLIFAGVDITSGREPVTLAALGSDLNVLFLERYDLSGALSRFGQQEHILLATNPQSSKNRNGVYALFKKKIARAGFRSDLKSARRQWIETNAGDCFRRLIGRSPLARRTLEGRIQRALILYDQGLQIADPMDFFEEITRHHMMLGEFPNELLYSASQLDALSAAYSAWMMVNERG